MPAMHFNLRWPDGTPMRCYSPSLVVKDHFAPGDMLPLPAFMAEVRTALNTASDRVRAKYGFACSLAMGQLAEIEASAARYGGRGEVEITGFED